MNINQIYYEELRSFNVDNKWRNRKIGIGASLDNENGKLSERLDDLKIIVRRELDRLDKEVTVNGSDKYENAKEFLMGMAADIKREVEIIDSGLPF